MEVSFNQEILNDWRYLSVNFRHVKEMDDLVDILYQFMMLPPRTLKLNDVVDKLHEIFHKVCVDQFLTAFINDEDVRSLSALRFV